MNCLNPSDKMQWYTNKYLDVSYQEINKPWKPLDTHKIKVKHEKDNHINQIKKVLQMERYHHHQGTIWNDLKLEKSIEREGKIMEDKLISIMLPIIRNWNIITIGLMMHTKESWIWKNNWKYLLICKITFACLLSFVH